MRVFISHSSKDKKFVRTIKDCLLENSIDIWLDEDQLDLGDSLVAKLEKALDDSSHLVIILSPASVESDWVNFELKKALQNNRTGLTSKIIPVKYRDCEIPEELTHLLHADLSDEVVLPIGDRVKFISNGFDNFFLQLVRAIRNSAKAINKDEKDEIIKSIKSTEKEIEEHKKLIHRGNYKVIGYTTLESRLKYQKAIIKKVKDTDDVEEVRPFVLPPSVKQTFNPSLGTKCSFEFDDFPFDDYGHFAGFRNDDLSIAIDKRTRNGIGIGYDEYYQIEIDAEKNLIRFVSKIKN